MTNAIQKSAPVAKLDTLRGILERGKGTLASVLPKHMTAERMVKLATVAASKDAKLLDCDPMSLLRSLMDASQLGLEPFTPLQQCYIIPYFNGKKRVMEAQFQVGYRGLIELVRRSDKVLSIEAHCVYENDEFDCVLGLETKLMHKPNWDGERGKMKLVYAVAKLKDGATQFEVMGKNSVDEIRGRSKSAQSGPWVTDYDQMACKTVLKRLIKYLPISIEAAKAVGIDNRSEGFEAPESMVFDVDSDDREQELEKIEAEAVKVVEVAANTEGFSEYRAKLHKAIKDSKLSAEKKSELMNLLVTATDKKTLDDIMSIVSLHAL
jgi:recombination protein RecT